MHTAINEAVHQACEAGVLTSASLAANGEAFDEAVDIAKKFPQLGVGLHLNWIEGAPVADPNQVNTLLKNGRFGERHGGFIARMLAGGIRSGEVRVETEAQISKCRQAGVSISHVDSHRHLHLFPPVTRVIAPILKENNLLKMRAVKTPRHAAGWNPVRRLAERVFARARRGPGRELAAPDFFLGFHHSGAIGRRQLKNWLDRLQPERTHEIGMHLGTDDRALESHFQWGARHGYHAQWQSELAALTDPGTIGKAVAENRARLINYHDL